MAHTGAKTQLFSGFTLIIVRSYICYFLFNAWCGTRAGRLSLLFVSFDVRVSECALQHVLRTILSVSLRLLVLFAVEK